MIKKLQTVVIELFQRYILLSIHNALAHLLEPDEERTEEGVIFQIDNDTIIRAAGPELTGTYKKVPLMLSEGNNG